jgi:diacylglycerol kinase (ATP)
MGRINLVESLNDATEGMMYVLRTQRNMRLHFLIALLVLTIGVYFNLPKMDLLALLFSITLVLVLEMVNTAIELTVDLIKDVYHPLARIIKDVMAGAVILSALNAVVVGYVIFTGRFSLSVSQGLNKIIRSPWHLTFISMLVVTFLVLLVKLFFHRGTPFRGGMPSGHAAFAFSLWTVTVFLTRNTLILTIGFMMAFLLARHRLKDRIHTLWEIIAGALLGMLSTALVFQLLF